MLLFVAGCDAAFKVHMAGSLGSTSKDISDGATICPTDYPMGFNVECTGVPSDQMASFKVNDAQYHVENMVPFFIAGNNDEMVNSWTDYPEVAKVACEMESGVQTVTISFKCDNTGSRGMPKKPLAPSLYFVPAGDSHNEETRVPVKDGITFCPMQEFGSSKFSIQCVEDNANMAFFRVNGAREHHDMEGPHYIGKGPYYIAGDTNGMPKPWNGAPSDGFTLVCKVGPGSKIVAENVRIACSQGMKSPMEPPTTTPPTTTITAASTQNKASRPKGCVVIPAKSTKLSDGWVDDQDDGVTFNPGNKDKGIVGPGDAPLYYKFIAPTTSRYAVVLDLTTRGRADYNDVFLRFSPGGFQLVREGTSKIVTDWVKGYQKHFARGASISSEDHSPHSMSTGIILEKGMEYELAIGGRSNQVTLHNSILFECDGLDCQRKKWKKDQEACLPGSTLHEPRPRGT